MVTPADIPASAVALNLLDKYLKDSYSIRLVFTNGQAKPGFKRIFSGKETTP